MSTAPARAPGDELGLLVVVVDQARHLPDPHRFSKQDPFVSLVLSNEPEKEHRTKVDKGGGQVPRWDEEKRMYLFPPPEGEKNYLDVRVMREERKDDVELIGEAKVQLVEGWRKVEEDGELRYEFDEWITLKESGKFAGEIYLEGTFYPRAQPSRPAPQIATVQRRPSRIDPATRLARPVGEAFPAHLQSGAASVTHSMSNMSLQGPPKPTRTPPAPPPKAAHLRGRTSQTPLLPFPGDPDPPELPESLRPGRPTSFVAPSTDAAVSTVPAPAQHAPPAGQPPFERLLSPGMPTPHEQQGAVPQHPPAGHFVPQSPPPVITLHPAIASVPAPSFAGHHAIQPVSSPWPTASAAAFPSVSHAIAPLAAVSVAPPFPAQTPFQHHAANPGPYHVPPSGPVYPSPASTAFPITATSSCPEPHGVPATTTPAPLGAFEPVRSPSPGVMPGALPGGFRAEMSPTTSPAPQSPVSPHGGSFPSVAHAPSPPLPPPVPPRPRTSFSSIHPTSSPSPPIRPATARPLPANPAGDARPSQSPSFDAKRREAMASADAADGPSHLDPPPPAYSPFLPPRSTTPQAESSAQASQRERERELAAKAEEASRRQAEQLKREEERQRREREAEERLKREEDERLERARKIEAARLARIEKEQQAREERLRQEHEDARLAAQLAEEAEAAERAKREERLAEERRADEEVARRLAEEDRAEAERVLREREREDEEFARQFREEERRREEVERREREQADEAFAQQMRDADEAERQRQAVEDERLARELADQDGEGRRSGV
ncbi:hypothetical protein JCM10207_003305 [Rhodosporidiobolus poonsookiae]